MPEKSGEHTITLARFRVFLNHWLGASGMTKTQAGDFFGLAHGNFSNILSGAKNVSLAAMEEIAEKIGADLAELLALGRTILEDEEAAGSEQPDLTPTPAPLEEEAAEESARDEQEEPLVPIPPVQAIPGAEFESDYFKIPYREDMRLAAGDGETPEDFYEVKASPVVMHKKALNRHSSAHLAAFKVSGDYMEPTIMEGGIVAVDLSQNEFDARFKEGAIYMLDLDPSVGQNAVKRLKWAEKDRLLMVVSDNPAVNPIFKDVRDVILHGRVIWCWGEFGE